MSQNQDDRLRETILNIEKLHKTEDIIEAIKKFDKSISVFSLNDRQYLTESEQEEFNQLIAKFKLLESRGYISNLIPDVTNSQLMSTIGNAFTSSEFVHYGTISSTNVIDCPKEYMYALSLLQQAKSKSENEMIDTIIYRIIACIKEGFHVDFHSHKITNGILSTEFNHDSGVLARENLDVKKVREKFSFENVVQMNELSNGLLGYNDTKKQLMALYFLAEMRLQKEALINLISQTLKIDKIKITELLQNTLPINPLFAIKQNGRGYQLTDSLNLIFEEFGETLENNTVMKLFNRINLLPIDEITKFLNEGLSYNGISTLLDVPEELNNQKDSKSQYIAEGIVDGYDWSQTRKLMPDERKLMLERLQFKDVSNIKIKRLYETFTKLKISDTRFSQEDIFAIIMNIALKRNLNGILYRDLLNMDSKEQLNTILNNKNSLETDFDPIYIGLTIDNGKTVARIKKNTEKLGVSREYLDKKRIQNVYMAYKIVEEFDFGRELSNEEKRVLNFSILNSASLNSDKHFYLSTFVKNLEELGLSKQEAYALIINMSIDRNVTLEPNLIYSEVLKSKKSCND